MGEKSWTTRASVILCTLNRTFSRPCSFTLARPSDPLRLRLLHLLRNSPSRATTLILSFYSRALEPHARFAADFDRWTLLQRALAPTFHKKWREPAVGLFGRWNPPAVILAIAQRLAKLKFSMTLWSSMINIRAPPCQYNYPGYRGRYFLASWQKVFFASRCYYA